MARTSTRDDYYYHAGCRSGDSIWWSEHIRLSAAAAEREARSMAKYIGFGYQPIVEFWPRKHGKCPRDCEVVAGAYDVL